MDLLYLSDLIGTFAFAVYGSYTACKKNFDIFGIVVCGFLCGLGGGTIREILFNKIPLYFFNITYIYVVFLGVAFCIFTYKNFSRINKFMLMLDAVGLSTFAFIGAARGVHEGLGLAGAVFFAVITSLGGGLLKDMIANEVPSSFRGEVYATPAILMGAFYFLFRNYMENPAYAFALAISIFLLRMVAIQYKVKVQSMKDLKKLLKRVGKNLSKQNLLFRR